MKRLEELCYISSGGTPSRKRPEFYGGDILWAKISDIENADAGQILDTEEKITEKGLVSIRNRIFKKGTLLFAMYGSIGKVAFASKDMSCNQAILGINPKRENEIYLPYLKIWFEQNNRILVQGGRGGVLKNLSATIIRNIKIELPSYDNQIRISELLAKVERLITQRKESIDQLDELLKSKFLEMFGDPALNTKEWPKISLSDLGSLERGVSKHRPRNAPELLGGKYPLIQTGDVANSGLYITKYSQTYSEAGFRQSKMWPEGTLCITIAANIAKTGILKFDACFPDSVVGFVNEKKEVVIYIHYLFGFLQRILEKNAPAAAQKNINLRILRELNVPNPDIDLLIKFNSIVGTVEGLRTVFSYSLHELKNLYGSLSQRAFEGGLDVSKVSILATLKSLPYLGPIEMPVKGSLEQPKEEVKPPEYKKVVKQEDKEYFQILTPFEQAVRSGTVINYKPVLEDLLPFISKHFSDEYFTFEQLKNSAIEAGWQYEFESLKNLVFELMRKENIKQVFTDSAFKSSLSQTDPDLVKTKALEEKMYLKRLTEVS
jgi:type I restriction enzyme, S subunit